MNANSFAIIWIILTAAAATITSAILTGAEAVAEGPSLTLTWTDNSANEDGFRIERSIDGEEFVEIGTVAADIISYTDVNLQPGRTYAYRVRAYNDAGASEYSNTATRTLPALPAAPTELQSVLEHSFLLMR